jgi:hypothetical protein
MRKSSQLSIFPLQTIYDNLYARPAGDFLRENISPGARLSVVSAYFTIYAFDRLREQLESIQEMRFLFGEPNFVMDPKRTENQAFRIREDALETAGYLQQKCAARACADWMRDKVQVKSVLRKDFLHSKLYHVANGPEAAAMVGSSNFTVSGLGLGDAFNNIELNLGVAEPAETAELLEWFDRLWADERLVEDVKDRVLAYLATLYRDADPEFIYYKTLFHVFADLWKQEEEAKKLEQATKITETGIWKALYEFQRDGAKGAINKIRKHGGCILADSVGLGKTFEALAVIKYFELLNWKVLVLCPKKLRDNWTVYQAQNNSELNPFVNDRLAYTVLCHTDLSREGGHSGDIDLGAIQWGNYDLVVIDESHNFRNNTPNSRDEDANLVRKSRYNRLLEDIIQGGVRTRVLMLSATPVNNNLKDLRNQLNFIGEGKDHAFRETIGVPSLTATLRLAQARFNLWAKEKGPRNAADLVARLDADFFHLLDELSIARSRKHILKYYKESVKALGGFPERAHPDSIFPDTHTLGKFPTYDQLNDQISAYRLALYNPSEFVKDDLRAKYKLDDAPKTRKPGDLTFTQASREHFLIAMMKVNFLKRLESSVHSFALTMERTVGKMDALLERMEAFRRAQSKDQGFDLDDVNPGAGEDVDEDDDLAEAWEVGGKQKYQFADLELDDWATDVRADRQQLAGLLEIARSVTPDQDAKLTRLKQLIAAKVQNPTTNKDGRLNRKLLVFTAFADTAEYLYRNLRHWARDYLGIHIALVSGGAVPNRTTLTKRAEFSEILANFSPVSKHRAQMKGMEQRAEIDLLIATDCISEGQNLQDCDYLVNYDIHWNPVRVIQRFGRIDRIGSLARRVHLVNFWPTEDLDKYLSLKVRVEARMALVDLAATNEDNPLSEEQIRDLIHDDLKYRDRQLARLQKEVLDLEDFDESPDLSDFSLDDFRMDLLRYLESNRQKLEDAPEGIYAVAPQQHPQRPAPSPGVIFCLRQKGDSDALKAHNPLQPYFLVYVGPDNTVHRTYAQPRHILELYRSLCQGVNRPYEELCGELNACTANGREMSEYSAYLKTALASIQQTMSHHIVRVLQKGPGAVLPPITQQVTAATEFDLVTWLAIR